ncbi:G-type lectin S-receptor-like serine/threonine-protein kinase At4g27290 [Linum perenne]
MQPPPFLPNLIRDDETFFCFHHSSMKPSNFTTITSTLSFLFLLFFTPSSTAADAISFNQSIADAQSQTLVSAGGSFELGFFTPTTSSSSSSSNSNLRFLGIWYNFSKQSIVWVANRDSPLSDSSGVLRLTSNGTLLLLNSSNAVVWSTNTTRKPLQNPVAQLLDSGNLVVTESGDENNNNNNYLWQSFDYLSDTILPGLDFGRNLETGRDSYLISWKSPDDPSPGDCTTRLDPDGYPQIYIRKGESIVFRSGPWNGVRFSGMPNLKPNPIYTYEFIYNDKGIYYRYDLTDKSVISRLVLDNQGILQRFTWTTSSRTWNLYLTAQMDNCDRYGLCGPYGSCNINNSPPCGCLIGFEPKSDEDWESGDWSGGCVRRNHSVCGNGEGFQKVAGVKLPDTRKSWFNRSMDLGECERVCSRNCSCTAYSTLNITDGSGCLLWFGELLDIREYTEYGQDFFIRLASSELGRGSKRKTRLWIIAICVLLGGIAILGLFYILYIRRKRLQAAASSVIKQERDYTGEETGEHELELPLFDFTTITNATDYFSSMKKLGEGGFGPVYKGVFKDGQEIAVKRLSKDSTQGVDEFKNEVMCIAKLQHRNLVKLLGCCIEKDEKVLVYEYMPNKGLDAFIFDEKQRALLDWPMRFHIINGIARGLLYLHQDSRLRIIHRDLKASNVLLDYEMNPKISDFGMARIFGANETQGNTKRVVGTYGYMSPEYAIDGLFSIKSDVFSFGVLVLEIVSGKRNRGFQHADHKHNLLGHAWRLYREGNPSEVMDETLRDTCVLSDLVRCIHVGLLCVQQAPDDRPNMSNAVLMLSSDILLPEPKEPGFFTERKVFEQESSSGNVDTCSANEITITLLTAR